MKLNFRQVVRNVTGGCMLLVAMMLTGCISPTFYVDTATRDVKLADFKKPAQPKSTQVSFEFQTKGVANARATDMLKAKVMDQIKESGLFASTSDQPVTGGAILNVVINNIPEADAASKGFKAGLTFGASGTKVTDNYLCTVTYLPPGKSTAIVKTTTHAIHTTIGNTSAPESAIKAENATVAAETMTRQIVGNALKDLSLDPAFP